MEKLDKVIAGLECCTERRCTKCPYLGQEMYCMSVLEKDALDVINGLRLRCNRLEAERDDLRKDVAVLSEDLRKLQKIREDYECGLILNYELPEMLWGEE